jgi:gamma-glutamyltranspeptidase/glutathione hydrolase
VYNGYLRAFKVQNVAHPHYLRPGAPARSNAAPTIAFRDGRAWLAVGNTGSERMCSGIFEVFLRLRRETPFAAVHGPRLHCTPKSRVLWEEQRFPLGCRQALVDHGFALEALDPYSFKVGGLHLALRQADRFVGVAEPRRDGAAGGPEG